MNKMKIWMPYLTGLAILTGFALSVVSFIGFCTSECQEAHDYRIFSIPFEILGLVFFTGLTAAYFLSFFYPAWWVVTGFMLLGAAGSEIVFILTQVLEMEHMCPVCMGIAGSVYAALIFYLLSGRIDMSTLTRRLSSVAVFFAGLVIAFLGIGKYDQLQAAENSIKESVYFGKNSSPIEAYLFTDWACPACRKLEGRLNTIAPYLMQEGKLIYVDHVIHPETLNFIPYNLSFMINNKPNYVKLRHILTKISEETGEPSEDEVESAVQQAGEDYQQLNYSDVAMGIRYFRELGKKFEVKGTPTLVIVNTETKKGKKLVGNREITKPNIQEAIKKLKM